MKSLRASSFDFIARKCFPLEKPLIRVDNISPRFCSGAPKDLFYSNRTSADTIFADGNSFHGTPLIF